MREVIISPPIILVFFVYIQQKVVLHSFRCILLFVYFSEKYSEKKLTKLYFKKFATNFIVS